MIVFALGIIIAQILNVFLRYFRQGSPEYLHYGIYLTAFVIYLVALHIEIIPVFSDDRTISFIAEEITRPTGVLLYILYNRFLISFLDLKTTSPSLYRIIYWFSFFLGLSLIFQVIVQSVFRNNIKVQDSLYGAFSFLVFIVSIYLIYRVWKFRTKLSAYILTGSICLSIGIFLTNGINYLMMLEKLASGQYYFYPLLIGLGLEIYFFNRGLHYKSSKVEKDLFHTQELLIEQMKEKEKLMIDRQEIRNKIARDLHDNIGSTLSSISVYSRVARIYSEQNKPADFTEALDKIETASHEMIGEMNDIVWTINPNNDSMQNMMLRMESFAKPLLQASGVQWEFDFDEKLANVNIDMGRRKNLYLIFKEAVNNAIKYARCKKIKVSVGLSANALHLVIEDDGIGFDTNAMATTGNGLNNMRRRAVEMNGLLSINSAQQKGTIIRLQFSSPN